MGDPDAVSLVFERSAEPLADVRLVVNDENVLVRDHATPLRLVR